MREHWLSRSEIVSYVIYYRDNKRCEGSRLASDIKSLCLYKFYTRSINIRNGIT